MTQGVLAIAIIPPVINMIINYTFILRIPVVEGIMGGSIKLPVVALPTIPPTVLITCIVYNTVELGCSNDKIKLSVALSYHY